MQTIFKFFHWKILQEILYIKIFHLVLNAFLHYTLWKSEMAIAILQLLTISVAWASNSCATGYYVAAWQSSSESYDLENTTAVNSDNNNNII